MPRIPPAPPRRNAPWTPFQRRTWLAERRRRSRLIFSAAASATLRTDLLAYWTLDEAAMSVRADASGNGWDLTDWDRQGNADAHAGQTAGVMNHAASFTDDFDLGLFCAAPTVWAFGGDFTVAGWFSYNPDYYDGQTVLDLGDALWVAIRAYQDALQFGVYTDTDPGCTVILTDDGLLTEGVWQHFAATRQGNGLTLYLNGEVVGLATMSGSPLTPDNLEIHLACGLGGYPLNGALDEFGLWQRALSATEVSQLYNGGAGWPFDDF